MAVRLDRTGGVILSAGEVWLLHLIIEDHGVSLPLTGTYAAELFDTSTGEAVAVVEGTVIDYVGKQVAAFAFSGTDTEAAEPLGVLAGVRAYEVVDGGEVEWYRAPFRAQAAPRMAILEPVEGGPPQIVTATIDINSPTTVIVKITGGKGDVTPEAIAARDAAEAAATQSAQAKALAESAAAESVDARTGAVDARDGAVTARDTSVGAAATATAASTQAVMAGDGAALARAGAEAAREDAIDAQTGATLAATSASGSSADAANSRQAAEDAADIAVSARGEAVSAASSANAAAIEVQDARAVTLDARDTAVMAAGAAGAARDGSEAARNSAVSAAGTATTKASDAGAAAQAAAGSALTADVSADEAVAARDASETVLTQIVAGNEGRPGETWLGYASDAAGTPIDPSWVVTGAAGRVVRLSGALTLTTLKAFAVLGREIGVDAIYRRVVDSTDPSNDAVEVGVFWFSAAGAPLVGSNAETVADTQAPDIVDGVRKITFQVSQTRTGPGIITPPAGAVLGKAFIRTHGATTDAESLDVGGDASAASQLAIAAADRVALAEPIIIDARDRSETAAAAAEADAIAASNAAAAATAVAGGSVQDTQLPPPAELAIGLTYAVKGPGGSGIYIYRKTGAGTSVFVTEQAGQAYVDNGLASKVAQTVYDAKVASLEAQDTAEQSARITLGTALNARDDAEQQARIDGDTAINQARYDGDVANAAATAAEVAARSALIVENGDGTISFEDQAGRIAGYIQTNGILNFMRALFDRIDVAAGAFATLEAAGLVVTQSSDEILSIGSPDGLDVFRILLNGMMESAAARIGGLTITADDDGTISFQDAMKRECARFDPDGTFRAARIVVDVLEGVTTGGGGDPTKFSDAELDAMNARSMAIAVERRSRKVPISIQRLTRSHLLSTVAGQSLSSAHEGFPPISMTARYGELMLGDSTRPKLTQQGNSTAANPLRILTGGSSAQGGTDTEAWITFGAPTLKPATATVVSNETLYTAAQYEGFKTGGFVGESVIFASAAIAKQAWNASRGYEVDDISRRFILINQGWGGTSSAEWQPAPNVNQVSSLYNIYINGIKAVRDAVDLATGSVGNLAVVDLHILQGEADGGGVMSKATFKGNWANMVANARAEVKGITGQDKDFAVFTYGTAGQFVFDAGHMDVQMGWLELAREQKGWYYVAPAYFVPDKGGHLFANGYRWLGAFFGKAKAKVLVDGTEWWPLAPTDLSCAIRGKTIIVPMCAPVYPLDWTVTYTGTKTAGNVDPYVIVEAQMFDNKGFNVLFNGVKQPNSAIASVTLPRDGLVQIELAANPPDGALVEVDYCGQQDYAGSGNLCDSDPYETDLIYEVVPGQIAAEQIPALIGKPYDMRNRCVPFRIPAIAQED